MVFPVIGGDGKPTGYEIDNSLRFNDDDSPSLNKTFGSGNRKTFTFSTWVKRANITNSNTGLFAGATDSNNRFAIMFVSDALYIQDRASNSNTFTLQSNKLFRDPSAWYHIVVAIDTTQGTEANRVKAYVNSTQITSFSSESYPSQNLDLQGNTNVFHVVGARTSNGSSATNFLDGYMSDTYFVDGSAEAPTEFGETNDNGVWIPKKANVTFGTNGFKLEFKQTGTGTASASTIGADTSGEDNHLTSTNLAAIDVTVDTPTNNFATLNPLNHRGATFSEGNTQMVGSASTGVSTICPSNGKWYMEFQNSAAQNSAIGVVNVDDHPSTTNIYPYTYAAAILLETSVIATLLYDEVASDGETSRDTTTNVGTTKIGMAVDLDNQDIYISTGGQWWGGSSFNQGTGPGTALITDLPTTGFAAGFYINGSITNACYYNFGNPGGADSISSGNADANGYGNFEYAVPSGYFALCTKNLAEFG